jgi:GPH family glycoside/pentoside/hexuronide:cation symporter
MNFFMCIQYSLSGSATVYYAKWIFKNENLLAVMAGIGIVPMAVGYVLTGPMVKKFGPAKASRIGLLIGVAGTVVRAFFPYSFVMNVVVGIFTGFGIIPFMSVYGALLNNTTEYNEWKTGNKMVGLTSSVSAFISKLATGLGGALIGWVLAAGGYNPNLAEQGQAAINSILAICIWIPGILLLTIYVALRFYDLDAKYPQIVKDLEERRRTSQTEAQ